MIDAGQIKKSDIIILCVIAILSAVTFASARGKPDGSVGQVTLDGEIIETVSLDEDKLIKLEALPHMEFEVKDGKIAVIASDCPDKVCINTGFIGSAGQKAVCLPNRVVVSVDGGSGEDDDFDIMVY